MAAITAEYVCCRRPAPAEVGTCGRYTAVHVYCRRPRFAESGPTTRGARYLGPSSRFAHDNISSITFSTGQKRYCIDRYTQPPTFYTCTKYGRPKLTCFLVSFCNRGRTYLGFRVHGGRYITRYVVKSYPVRRSMSVHLGDGILRDQFNRGVLSRRSMAESAPFSLRNASLQIWWVCCVVDERFLLGGIC